MSKVVKLDWCSHEAAKYAVTHWHYSKCVPNQKTAKLGVWEEKKFIGCVLFGDGANNNLYKPFGLSYEQGAELVRVALSQHKTPVSKIVSIALRLFQKAYPTMRLVLSFADPEQGHMGGIYQAGNWFYLGETLPADEYIVKGKRMHGRALRSTRSTHPLKNVLARNVLDWAQKVIDPMARAIDGSSKHRYAMPLDAEMRAQILPLAKPYPKRAGSADSGTSGFQPEGGGATPTPALTKRKAKQLT